MVPQPPRVPRCDTCRARKVKCDYALPMCGPCVKARRRCPGYGQAQAQFVSYVKVSDLAVNPGPLWRSSMYDQFLSVYLPRSPGSMRGHSCMWTTEVAGHRTFGPLEAAATALGLSTVAKAHGDAGLAARGLQLYGSALSKLRSSLAQAATMAPHNADQWADTLLTVMLFQLTELMIPSAQGWGGFLSHTLGLSSLIQASDPAVFQKPGYHKAFLYCRASLILSGIISDTPTFLAKEEWRTVPWLYTPKTDIQSLLDILCHIPELTALSRKAGVDESSAPEGAPSLSLLQYKDRLNTLTESLRIWRSDASVRDAIQAHEDNVLPQGEQLDPEEIQIVLFYCMTGLLIHQSSMYLDKLPTSPNEGREDDDEAEEVWRMSRMADTIIRTVPFCLREENGFVSVTFALLPLRTAAGFYKRHRFTRLESTCVALGKRLEEKSSIVTKPNKAIGF